MLEPGLPPEEKERLKALEILKILDTLPEDRFDRITRMVQRFFDVPICLVSLVDANRQWFKSRQGLDASETPRNVSFCGHAILASETFIVEDAHKDRRFSDNPLVTEAPHVRFYAGQPLATPGGHHVGTLCIIDHEPRRLSPEQLEILRNFGAMMETELRMQELHTLRDELDTIAAQNQKLELDRRRHWDHSLDLLCVLDLEGRTMQINPAWESVTGHHEQDILRRRMGSFVHAEDREDAWEATRSLLGSDGALTLEARVRCKDGSYRWILWTAVASKEDERIFAIGRDISERKIMERKLAESNHELEHFASVASHDLQEPLRKIMAFGDRLNTRSAGDLDEKGLDYLARMQGAAGRMSNLINALLSYSKVRSQTAPSERVDLNEVVATVLSDLEIRIEETGAKVEVGELPAIQADPTQFRQLLQNLIGNALKFRKPNVAPELRVWSELPDSESNEGGAVEIHVQDNGIGFEERFADRIFDVFQRLHGRQQYEGTGVGLSICRRIAQRHDGTIRASSELGRGSRFTVTLPKAKIRAEVEAHVPA